MVLRCSALFAGNICDMGSHQGNGGARRRGGHRDAARHPAVGPGTVDGDQAAGRLRQFAEEGAAGSFKKGEDAPTDVVMGECHDRRAARPPAYATFNDDRAVNIRHIARSAEGLLKRGPTFRLRLAEAHLSDGIRLGPDAMGLDAFPGVRAVIGPGREGA